MNVKYKQLLKFAVFSIAFAGVAAYAAGTGTPTGVVDTSATSGDIASMASNVGLQVKGVVKLMIGVSYLAGVGFGIAAIFKFKAHKDNPTQVPIGTPFALLAVSILLVFLPGIFKPAARSVFGTTSVSMPGYATKIGGAGTAATGG